MRKSLVLVLLLASVHIWAQSAKKSAAPVTLFTVNSTPVTTDEFIYLYRKNHLKPEDFTEEKLDEYLALFINFKLKVVEATSRGLDTTAAFKKEFDSYKEELKKPYIAEKDDLDRLTKEAYQRLTEEVKASHLLITLKQNPTPEDTLAAYNRIMQIRARIIGGEDFDKVAKETSEDPSAKTNGGNLGYFTALQMVYPFEQAAYTLKVGEISQPVRTRFGYHLLKVTDRVPARGEVEVSHILLRTGTGDDKKVKNKILDIYDQLRGGRSWDELAKEYSDDPATKDSGGKLRPFGVGALSGVPEFEKVAFSLKEPGEISDPFQSAYGWHIVKLERKLPVPEYKDVQDALRRKISRDDRLQIADRKRLEKEKKEYGFAENLDVKNTFIQSADSSLIKGQWKFKGDASLRPKTIFTLRGQNYTVDQLISFIGNRQLPVSQLPADYMTDLYNRWVNATLSEIEEKQLMIDHPDFRNLLTEYKEGILLFTIMEKEVWNRNTEDSVEVKKFYESQKEKYKVGERVRARVFSTSDKKFLEEVKMKISAGDSLRKEDAKKFKAILPARNYERGENKAVDKVSWSIGVHDAQVEETYYLVEIQNLLPPGIKSFAEAHAQVVADYQDVLEKKWVGELKQKYPVKMNNKGKKIVLRELIKK